MKTDLPQPAEYYRPSHARELRERAARLERWCSPGIRIVTTWLAASAAIATVALRFFYHRDAGEWLLAALVLSCAVNAARGRAARFRAQADGLEAEHAAR